MPDIETELKSLTMSNGIKRQIFIYVWHWINTDPYIM